MGCKKLLKNNWYCYRGKKWKRRTKRNKFGIGCSHFTIRYTSVCASVKFCHVHTTYWPKTTSLFLRFPPSCFLLDRLFENFRYEISCWDVQQVIIICGWTNESGGMQTRFWLSHQDVTRNEEQKDPLISLSSFSGQIGKVK